MKRKEPIMNANADAITIGRISVISIYFSFDKCWIILINILTGDNHFNLNFELSVRSGL